MAFAQIKVYQKNQIVLAQGKLEEMMDDPNSKYPFFPATICDVEEKSANCLWIDPDNQWSNKPEKLQKKILLNFVRRILN